MKTRWFIIFIFMALVSITGLFIPESDTLYNVVDKNINYADTSWMITSSVLVLLMTPGVSFFYGGMVRAKNIKYYIYYASKFYSYGYNKCYMGYFWFQPCFW